jgi:hypothetical protein
VGECSKITLPASSTTHADVFVPAFRRDPAISTTSIRAFPIIGSRIATARLAAWKPAPILTLRTAIGTLRYALWDENLRPWSGLPDASHKHSIGNPTDRVTWQGYVSVQVFL